MTRLNFPRRIRRRYLRACPYPSRQRGALPCLISDPEFLYWLYFYDIFQLFSLGNSKELTLSLAEMTLP